MAKNALEKAIEKQMKQTKQLDAKRKREEEKRAREEAAEARKTAIREKAMTIVNGQPLIGGMRFMDQSAEELFRIIIEKYDGNDDRRVEGNFDIIPTSYHSTVPLEFEKMCLYGIVASSRVWGYSMWEVVLTPQGVKYFELKENALKRQVEEQKQMSVGNITNYGNIVFGNVSNSTLSVDNSIHELERMIDEQGGEDKEELLELLDEVKELLENIQTSRNVPKQKKLFQRISDHVAKHGWFYGAIVQLLGTATLSMLGV